VPATLICSNCGTENEAGRKFCVECGHRLASACPVCGTVNAPSAKFCGECGNALGPGLQGAQGIEASTAAAGERLVQTREAPVAERRLVSVLFVDLVGFTTASEQRDAEDTRELLSTYFETAREVVERHGGVIEKFIGDAVMAVWGTPTAHEDDAERAVRTALQLVESVGQMEAGGLKLQARAGVLTGEAAVTIGATGQGMVAGDLVNTASRLQSAAAPGTVLVGEGTYRAAQGAITFESVGEQTVKGKEAPVPAWRAIAVVARRGGSGRAAQLEPPFVGRNEELRTLRDQFHATAREGKPRLVTVVGQAGIGKSRLGWELEKYLDGVVETVFFHEGRSPSYGEGISYWALAEMVRGRAGIAESDDQETARDRLRQMLEQMVPDATERRWIELRLIGLLGLDELPAESREELFAAWRTFLERIAEQGTVLLVFWDLQWADQGLLDFIEHVLTWARTSPIFVLAEARPELFERRPGWGVTVRSATSIHLEPLSNADMRALLAGLVPGLPEHALRAIVERAAGVPLYAVETLRMLIDRGALEPEADGARYTLVSDLPELAVPESLHALIAARLDAIEPHERGLITDAAVLGLSFTVEALRTLADLDSGMLATRLEGLVKHELLVLDADPRSPERGQYKFVQGVVREVAYQSLAKRERRAKHLAAARYFEALGEDELSGVLASHYLAAFRATPAGPEADALAAQARVALRAAADRASALHSQVGALTFLEQALDVTTDPGERAAIHERAATAATVAAQTGVAAEHAREAEQIFAAAGDRLGVLRMRTLDAWVKLSEHGDREAIVTLERALADVQDLPPSPEIARAQAELGRALMVGGSPDGLAWLDRAIENHALLAPADLVDAIISKGSMVLQLGRIVEAEVLLRGAIAVADRIGDPNASLRGRNNLAGVVARRSLEETMALIMEGLEISRRFGHTTSMLQAINEGIGVAFGLGRWEDLFDEYEADIPEEEDNFYRLWYEAHRAARLTYRGRPDEAMSIAQRALAMPRVRASAQALAAYAAQKGDIFLAQQRWGDAFETTREAWDHNEWGLEARTAAVIAAAAAGDRELAEEASGAVNTDDALAQMPLVQGRTHAIRAVVALLGERWDEARTEYASAKRLLADGGDRLALARFQLALSQLAADHLPDMAEAGREAEAFFHERGADAYVAAYRGAAAKPSQATASARSSRATSDAQRETEPTTR
jgi:class 3 adenylate cyclase/tetratricopeptide (TPR) repeat protein